MRFCWIINGDESFGVKRAVDTLMDGVAEAGHDVGAIAVRSGGVADVLQSRGRLIARLDAPVARKLSGSFLRRASAFVQNSRQLRSIQQSVLDHARSWSADVIHVLWPSFMPLGGFVARAMGAPCFWEMTQVVGSGYPLDINKRILQRTCAKYGVQPLANSAYTAHTLGDHPIKPIVFHLGADTQRFDPEAVTPVSRESLDLPHNAVVFGVFATLLPVKGQRLLVETLSRMPADQRPHLLMVGGPLDGDEAAHIRESAATCDAAHLVRLVDYVPDPERYYPAIDVAVNALLGAEAFGLSVVEAMLMRKPVLAHALGGPAETVIDGRTGWHVAEPTVEAFAAGVTRAFDDRHRWEEMGREARAHAVRNFSRDVVTARYLEVVRNHFDRRNTR